ncbi:hypothetical protein JB92DRAFT_403005 [Gautieria morchelliformis]|nr:hypothetical protein JB92DRAFT_403005 [Gautieria morchelliformis]
MYISGLKQRKQPSLSSILFVPPSFHWFNTFQPGAFTSKMYSAGTAAIILMAFLQFLTVPAAPLVRPRAAQSASLATLPSPYFSPYYLYFGNPNTVNLSVAFAWLHMKAATIAFASAPKGKCELTADLNSLVGDTQDYIAKGGVLTLGFGGNLADPTVPRQHVQQACTDVTSLSNLIISAMSTFNTHNIEFDIEDDDLLTDTASATRLAQALIQVKNKYSDTYITYTLGANPSGLPPMKEAYVQATQSAGFEMDVLMLMTMNMGGTDIVKDSQTAVLGGAAQLEKIYSLSSGEGIKKMGMLPSIGVDNYNGLLDLQGATTLGQFVKSQGMSSMSCWSFNRDFPGTPSGGQSLDVSSSPDQHYIGQFFLAVTGALNGGFDTQSASKHPSNAAGLPGDKQAALNVSSIAVPPPSTTTPGQKASLPSPTARSSLNSSNLVIPPSSNSTTEQSGASPTASPDAFSMVTPASSNSTGEHSSPPSPTTSPDVFSNSTSEPSTTTAR